MLELYCLKWKKVKKNNALNCWMFSFEYFWRLDVLHDYEGLWINILQFLF